MKRYKVKLTFTEPILGTVPKSQKVYGDYVASKAALNDEELAEELETVEHTEEKGWTGFHILDGKPILYDYVIRGFFKDACGMLRRVKGTQSSKLTAYKKIIDGLVFVAPRRIPIVFDGDRGVLERPLRASTAQGERVTLARSDTCPEGATVEFYVEILGGVDEATLREWLDYGKRRGLGQWRNGGWGTFCHEMTLELVDKWEQDLAAKGEGKAE